jgi:hypothetical protein
MTEQTPVRRPTQVRGPDGEPMSIDDLPSPQTRRWVIRRKAKVVAAVSGGLISLEEACKRYSLSVEEFLSWQRAIDKHGLPGLRVTRLQQYRQPELPETGDSSSEGLSDDDVQKLRWTQTPPTANRD